MEHWPALKGQFARSRGASDLQARRVANFDIFVDGSRGASASCNPPKLSDALFLSSGLNERSWGCL